MTTPLDMREAAAKIADEARAAFKAEIDAGHVPFLNGIGFDAAGDIAAAIRALPPPSTIVLDALQKAAERFRLDIELCGSCPISRCHCAENRELAELMEAAIKTVGGGDGR